MAKPRYVNETSVAGFATAAVAACGGLGILLFGGLTEAGVLLLVGAAVVGLWTWFRSVEPSARETEAEARRAARGMARLPRCPRCREVAAWRLMPGGNRTDRTWHCPVCGAKLRSAASGGLADLVRWALLPVWLIAWFGPFSWEIRVGALVALLGSHAITFLSRRVRLADGGWYCPWCGYDRAGTSCGVCSECGHKLQDLAATGPGTAAL